MVERMRIGTLLAVLGLGAAMAVALAAFRPRPATGGAMEIRAQQVDGTVFGTVVLRVTGGTPPIRADVSVRIVDEGGGEVRSIDKTFENLEPGATVKVPFSFSAEPGKTYVIYATAVLSNRYGKTVLRASKRVSIPGKPPRGEVGIVVGSPSTTPAPSPTPPAPPKPFPGPTPI